MSGNVRVITPERAQPAEVTPIHRCVWGRGRCAEPVAWEARHEGSDVPSRLCSLHALAYFDAWAVRQPDLLSPFPLVSLIRVAV